MSDLTTCNKVRLGLWTSLQKHLAAVHEADAAYAQAVPLPVALSNLLPRQPPRNCSDTYGQRRRALLDLFTDETNQLETLTKAIRVKGYAKDEKKHLYLLLLGYMDIAATVFTRLLTQVGTALLKDEELAETTARFARVQSFQCPVSHLGKWTAMA